MTNTTYIHTHVFYFYMCALYLDAWFDAACTFVLAVCVLHASTIKVAGDLYHSS